MNKWNGGVMPVRPGTLVRVELRGCGHSAGLAEQFLWGHNEICPHGGEIIGWENLTEAGWLPCDVASEGLPCFRYAHVQAMHGDGAVFCDDADDIPWTNAVAWRPAPPASPAETPTWAPKLTAPAVLEAAAELMRERGKTYDAEGGERSMGKTVAAFNAITGKSLRESEGWLLLALLKATRSEARKDPHRDSCEDLVAYGALYAEARLGGA